MKRFVFALVLAIAFAACKKHETSRTRSSGESPEVKSGNYIPSDSPVGREIEAIFAGQEAVDGDVDVDGVLEALDRLLGLVSRDDLPELLAAIEAPRNSFWTRELFAEPIAKVGGLATLPELIAAFHQNSEEGHDNDHFSAILINLVEADPPSAMTALDSLKPSSDPRTIETAAWLMQFAK